MVKLIRCSGVLAALVLVPAASAGAQQIAAHAGPGAAAQERSPRALLDRPAQLRVEDVPLATAFMRLGRDSGVRLAFSPSLVPSDVRVTCLCEDVAVKDALARILEGTPLRYSVAGERILIEPVVQAPRGLQFSPPQGGVATEGAVLSAQAGSISGRVLDAATNTPLAGAQVGLDGTTLGGLTNRDGRYLLLNVPAGSYTLRVQYIGYGARTQAVEVPEGGTVVADFELRTAAIELEGVVVTGTAGQARRREVGNSIAQINASELANAPIRDVGDALQARVTGGLVVDNSGQAGAGRRIRLRGFKSVSQANYPLIYVDGVRITSDPFPSAPGTSQASSPLGSINPADIERIEVVKGAAASTLYGTEANAGVIQIFTKKGSQGEPQWSLSIKQGINNLGHVGPKEDPTGLFVNDCTQFPGCPESGAWLRNGHAQDYQLSVQGGSERLTYFLSGRWGHEEGVIDPQHQQEWGIRGNFGFNAGRSLDVRVSNSYSYRGIQWIPDGNNSEAFLINVIRGPASNSPNFDHRPILEAEHWSYVHHLTSGINVTWTPGALSHRLNAGVDLAESEASRERPWGFVFLPDGDRETNNRHNVRLTMDYAGTWATQWSSDLSSSFSWGGQLYDQFRKSINATGEDFSGPGAKVVDSGARTNATESRLRVVSGGLFLQEMIGWRDRLFLTGGVRWDGFSTFGEGAGLVAYPKLAAAYTLSDHDFWPQWWETMKVRAAVGESGMAPGAFDAERVWQSVAGDNGQPAVTPANPGNPDLGPERTRELEFGFEGTAFDGLLSFEFTRYNARTYDALIPVQQTPSMGFVASQLENVGELKSWGNELFLGVAPLRRPSLDWELGVRMSTSETRAVDLGGLEAIAAYVPLWQQWIRPGLPIPSYWGPVVQNPDALGVPPVFENRYLGPVYPRWTVSLNSGLTLFQRLTVQALGEFLGGHYLTSGVARQQVRRNLWPECIGIQERIQAGDIGGLTARQQARCRPNTTYLDWTDRADYFKLRQISLAYRVPEQLLPGGADAVTLRLEGSNLLTLTDYPGIDPEAIEGGSQEGSAAFYRVEYYNLPPSRRFRLGVDVNF